MHIPSRPARLLGLGTAVPPHKLPQDLVKIVAGRILGARYPDFERMSKSFAASGIDTRYSVVSFEWFEDAKNWRERTEAYLLGATALFIAAAKNALLDAGWRAEDVDAIVTISST